MEPQSSDEVLDRFGVRLVAPLGGRLNLHVWWAFLIDGACQYMRNGIRDDGWIIRKLLQRSPLMGPDSGEFR
jgi:hypothetical protein